MFLYFAVLVLVYGRYHQQISATNMCSLVIATLRK